MRTFKFRAWDGNKIHYTDDFTLLQFKKGSWIMLTTDGSDSIYWAEERKENNVLMQFTGLLDKNGKEIYEGDIVADRSHTDLVFSIQYDTEHAGYYMPEAFDEECRFPISEVELEVIGNIYENPELLTN